MDYPKISTVSAIDDTNLLVRFENGITKEYDCSKWLILKLI